MVSKRTRQKSKKILLKSKRKRTRQKSKRKYDGVHGELILPENLPEYVLNQILFYSRHPSIDNEIAKRSLTDKLFRQTLYRIDLALTFFTNLKLKVLQSREDQYQYDLEEGTIITPWCKGMEYYEILPNNVYLPRLYSASDNMRILFNPIDERERVNAEPADNIE